MMNHYRVAIAHDPTEPLTAEKWATVVGDCPQQAIARRLRVLIRRATGNKPKPTFAWVALGKAEHASGVPMRIRQYRLDWNPTA